MKHCRLFGMQAIAQISQIHIGSPMAKFRLLKEWVDHHVPTTALFTPTPCPIDVLVQTHDLEYVSGFQSGTLGAKSQER